jgi:hypothetical protein
LGSSACSGESGRAESYVSERAGEGEGEVESEAEGEGGQGEDGARVRKRRPDEMMRGKHMERKKARTMSVRD